jgi:hypothetical protein
MSRIAVTMTAHKNKGSLSNEKTLEDRDVRIVERKLIDPRIELTPDKCRLKIARSTEMPEWYL